MKILSISIDKNALSMLENARKRLGYKSRSKMLRDAVSVMLEEQKELDSLKGNVESVLILTYNESEKNHVSDLLHKFEDIIKTDLHQHNLGTCVEILNAYATADKTRMLIGALKRKKCIYSLTYTIVKPTK